MFCGIKTRKGFELYEQIIKALSNGNKRKVSAESLAREWNLKVRAMIDGASNASHAATIRREFGYISTQSAQDHADRLDVRVVQTDHVGTVADELLQINAMIKGARAVVGERGLPSLPSSLSSGVHGPGANIMQSTALVPQAAAEPHTNKRMWSSDIDELKNTCPRCLPLCADLSEALIRGAGTNRGRRQYVHQRALEHREGRHSLHLQTVR